MESAAQINKLIITTEAEFDYENIVFLGRLPKLDIKTEVEEYINNLVGNGRISRLCRYFKVKYFDEKADRMLMLFIYRGERFGQMQLWKLSGICAESDWNEELEADGAIRNWLKTVIDDIPDEEDWVERYRKWKQSEKDYQKEFTRRKKI